MIIAIFGIQRSGKTSLITELCMSSDKKFIHVKSATKTLELFHQIYGIDRNISTISFREQELVTSEFKKYLEKQNSLYDIVLCDCHYAYRDLNGEYKKIHKESFFDLFDLFIYLDTDIHIINQRMAQTSGEKSHYNFTIQDLKEYKNFEINGLKHSVAIKKLIIVSQNNQIEEIKKLLHIKK